MKNNSTKDTAKKSKTKKAKEKFDEVRASAFVKNAIELGKRIKESKPIKFLTSPLVGRIIGVTTIALAVAGVTVVAWPVTVAAAAGLAAGVVIDTALVHKTRRLYKEVRFLKRHRQAAMKQEEILKNSPHFKKALAGHLYTPETKGKSKTERITKETGKWQYKAKKYGLGFAFKVLTSVGAITEAVIMRNPRKVIGLSFNILKGVVGEGSKNVSLGQARNEMRKMIDYERGREDSPAYNNLSDLRKADRAQKIQTLALLELEKEPAMKNASPAEIQTRFQEIKADIDLKTKTYGAGYRVRQYGKDFYKAMSPFSSHNDPKKVVAKLDNKRTKEEFRLNRDKSKPLSRDESITVAKTVRKDMSRRGTAVKKLNKTKAKAQAHTKPVKKRRMTR